MSLLTTQILPFEATAYQNGAFKTITDADLKGHWSVVFFYPADFTFVCPTELEDLAERYEDFKKIGVEIYSVSTDTHFTHKAWHESSEAVGKVQFPMVGDPSFVLCRNFDSRFQRLPNRDGRLIICREVPHHPLVCSHLKKIRKKCMRGHSAFNLKICDCGQSSMITHKLLHAVADCSFAPLHERHCVCYFSELCDKILILLFLSPNFQNSLENCLFSRHKYPF